MLLLLASLALTLQPGLALALLNEGVTEWPEFVTLWVVDALNLLAESLLVFLIRLVVPRVFEVPSIESVCSGFSSWKLSGEH